MQVIMLDLKTAIAEFGVQTKAKLANPSASGEPEDQLRAPLEALFANLALICGFEKGLLTAVGESSLSSLKHDRITQSRCAMFLLDMSK
jgi:hypothetical protein